MDSLNALGKEMKMCRQCVAAGFEITPGAIFSHPKGARMMLIGQAPGVTEVQAQRPFNAGSGRRLFQWLAEVGWAEDDFRASVAMSAVTKCYPGKGSGGKGDRVPGREEQRLCRPFLDRELALIRPRLVILVGGVAIKLLYPARWRLDKVIGTAVYLPANALKDDPWRFAWDAGHLMNEFDGHRDEGGRWFVPLPHPSGASLWPNKPQNKERISRAVHLIETIRAAVIDR